MPDNGPPVLRHCAVTMPSTQVRCDREAGHRGRHVGATTAALYRWANWHEEDRCWSCGSLAHYSEACDAS
jgi:hypothetical protein